MIIGSFFLGLLAILYCWYVSIVVRRNKALEALSGIDVQLKNRSDLIPNILKIAQRFMQHEVQIFTEVTKLREALSQDYNKKNSDAVKQHLIASEELSQKMSSLMLRAESYPELKSNENMIHAQRSYNEVEAQIAAARRFYNSAVASLRNSIEIFPGSLVASLAGVKTMPLCEVDENSKSAVDASKFL